MKIVQLANFVSPTSGGIARTMDRLAQGYVQAGHEVVQVIPGPRTTGPPGCAVPRCDGRGCVGRGCVGGWPGEEGLPTHPSRAVPVHRVAAPVIPRSGGYRMILDLGAVRRTLEDLEPDHVEVHDRFSLRSVGTWAAGAGVGSTMIVHERLDRLAPLYIPWVLRPAHWARRDNAAVAARFDRVVSPSRWAAQEFQKAGVDVDVVNWGVDLQVFHPSRRSEVLRRRLLGQQKVLLVMVCRLSPEKKPASALAALEDLRRRGVDAQLVVAGTGQIEAALRRQAKDLPVTFLGHLAGRRHVAELLAASDVVIAPGPIETFGLAGLEALACGTPVVSSRSGAIAELLCDPFGIPAYNNGRCMGSAVHTLLGRGEEARQSARAKAEHYPWKTSVQKMLRIHGAAPVA